MKYSKRLSILLEFDPTLLYALGASLIKTPGNDPNNTQKPDESKTNNSNNLVKTDTTWKKFLDGESGSENFWNQNKFENGSCDDFLILYLAIRHILAENSESWKTFTGSNAEKIRNKLQIEVKKIEKIEKPSSLIRLLNTAFIKKIKELNHEKATSILPTENDIYIQKTEWTGEGTYLDWLENLFEIWKKSKEQKNE